jgi:hypothetical protein
MKTSIIVSTFAVLCMMITFTEAPTRNNNESKNVITVSRVSSVPSNFVVVNSVKKNASAIKRTVTIETPATPVEDFSYLKFDVSAYPDNNEMPYETNSENSFAYLKFDVNEYSKDNNPGLDESSELPANEFEYLKFDIAGYSSSTEVSDYESSELPSDDFENLKFDVNNYVGAGMTDTETIDLPVDEFSYLKFDVTKYASQDVTDADQVAI